MALDVRTEERKWHDISGLRYKGISLHVVRSIDSAEAGTNYGAKELQGC